VAGEFILNPKQKAAIEHPGGPVLVLAGAGTGKTTVLVERIAWLIEQKHARPEEILAITFTENAAWELKSRVERRLSRRAPISTGTFHGYCFDILRRTGKDFFVLTPEDVYVFLRQRIAQLELKRFIKPSDLGQFLEDLRDFFDRCHEELIGPEEFQKWVDCLQPGVGLPRNCKSKQVDELGDEEILERWREIARVYRNATRLLEEERLGTFGMMISGAVKLLRSDPALLAEEQARARFILIDEFQDCNSSNISLAEVLAGEEQNIFAVGDPDQAIYRFRGASSAAFEEFQRRFPGTRGVALDENQRSRGNILRVAFAAIDQNPPVRTAGVNVEFERAPLQSGRDLRETQNGLFAFDEPVEIVISRQDQGEAGDIADAIQQLRQGTNRKHRPSMAVLYRSHFHREKLIEALAARQIPFIVKGLDVLSTPLARDLLAVVNAVINENDAESMFRICAFPQFKVEPEELRIRLAGAGRDKTFKSVLETFEGGKRVLDAAATARAFVREQGLTATGALTYLARQFELPEGDPAIRALLRFAREWEAKPFIEEKFLPAWLAYLELFQEGGGSVPLHSEEELAVIEEKNPEAVRLMTVHGAKGLEFDHVWVLRAIAPAFPVYFREKVFEYPADLRRSLAIGDSKEVHEQEERRLFYVAITRARDRLAIHSRPGRGKDATPPGFLRPIMQNRRIAAAILCRQNRVPNDAASAVAEISPISTWMLMPPAFNTAELALSANAVESYSTCPLRFKLERDWKIPGEAAVAMQYGSAIHTVLRQYYDPAPNTTEQSADELVAAFKAEFGKAVIDDPYQRELYEKQGGEQLRALLRSQPRGSMEVIGAEVSFNFTLGTQKMRGRIDRMDRIEGNEVRVIDYKTGAPKTRRYADDSLQLSIYSMGASAMGYVPRELLFLNLQGTEMVSTTRTPPQLQKARLRIEDAARGIATGEFEPSPGQHCVWCEYRRLCPATEQRVFVPAKTLTMETETKVAGVNG